MADALIETMSSNPYDGIVADTATQISNIDAQIQQVSSAITNLEQASPTSPTLPKLRERLAQLQSQKQGLTTTNESAKTLSSSFNQSSSDINTLKGIYDIKQQELERAKAQDDAAYRRMYDETQRLGDNYVNTLQNATASENAIINANAGRQGASSQSTAEVRARNYLNAAAAGNEAANNTRQQLNAIEEGRINSGQGYVQLSQGNADNYLRQQVLNDYQSSEAGKDRQFQREMSGRSSGGGGGGGGTSSSTRGSSGGGGGGNGNGGNNGGSEIVDPYEEFTNPEQENNDKEYQDELRKELNRAAFEEQSRKQHADDLYYSQPMFTNSSIGAGGVAPFGNQGYGIPKTREQLLKEEQDAIARAEEESKRKKTSQAYWGNNNMVH